MALRRRDGISRSHLGSVKEHIFVKSLKKKDCPHESNIIRKKNLLYCNGRFDKNMFACLYFSKVYVLIMFR